MARLTTHDGDELLAHVARHCDGVIAVEVDRLRRRRPGLSAADLAALHAALTDLADRLLLDSIRRQPALHDAVAPVFSPLETQRRGIS
ncbi:hypothetical protein MU582_01130 [Nocardioidaceae bacterium SCSIO 66511]|nr:hypothetical protein MU582_01130 [Nocardioidaceae bacterium SCSIO 66511]